MNTKEVIEFYRIKLKNKYGIEFENIEISPVSSTMTIGVEYIKGDVVIKLRADLRDLEFYSHEFPVSSFRGDRVQLLSRVFKALEKSEDNFKMPIKELEDDTQ